MSGCSRVILLRGRSYSCLHTVVQRCTCLPQALSSELSAAEAGVVSHPVASDSVSTDAELPPVGLAVQPGATAVASETPSATPQQAAEPSLAAEAAHAPFVPLADAAEQALPEVRSPADADCLTNAAQRQ